MSLTRLAAGVALAALAFLPSHVSAAEVIDLTPPTLAPNPPKEEPPKGDESKGENATKTGPAETPRTQPQQVASHSDSGSSHEIDTQPMLQTRHFGAQIELTCALANTPNDLLLVNHGPDPLPAGSKIKWQIKDAHLVGYFAIIGELEPGETLVADNIVNGKPDGGAPCVARLI